MLFDGQPEADAQVAAAGEDVLRAARRRAQAAHRARRRGRRARQLAARYSNPALGEIAVSRAGGTTVFDFGEWKSEVASRKNPDGTVSFLTIAPGISGFEFVVGTGPKKTLVTRDAQHEYVFESR